MDNENKHLSTFEDDELDDGEELLAHCEGHIGSLKGGWGTDREKLRSGVLVLTNKRISFFATRGLLSNICHDIYLQDLVSVEVTSEFLVHGVGVTGDSQSIEPIDFKTASLSAREEFRTAARRQAPTENVKDIFRAATLDQPLESPLREVQNVVDSIGIKRVLIGISVLLALPFISLVVGVFDTDSTSSSQQSGEPEQRAVRDEQRASESSPNTQVQTDEGRKEFGATDHKRYLRVEDGSQVWVAVTDKALDKLVNSSVK